MKNINQGSVYFWKYKTDGWIGSEWHFYCNRYGRTAFLQALDSLLKADVPARVIFNLNKVTKTIFQRTEVDLPAENRSALILNYKPGDANFNEWTVFDNEIAVELSFGKAVARQWINAFQPVSGKTTGAIIGLGEDDTVYVWR